MEFLSLTRQSYRKWSVREQHLISYSGPIINIERFKMGQYLGL